MGNTQQTTFFEADPRNTHIKANVENPFLYFGR